MVRFLVAWRDFACGVARFLQPWRDIGSSQTCLFKLKSVPNIGGDDFGEQKCDFNTQKTAEGAISSSLIQFMYVLILSLIMLFVNSIMSS